MREEGYQISEIRSRANSDRRSAIRRREKRDGNTEVTENRTQRAQREARRRIERWRRGNVEKKGPRAGRRGL
jgi:hypothetical protein